jgi:YVTN family beta-propeller protein
MHRAALRLSLLFATLATTLPAQSLLVLNKSANELAIIDPQTKAVLARIPTGNAPHEIVASDDGKFAYVSNYGQPPNQPGNTLSVYDLAAQKEIHRVDISPLRAPHGLLYSDGKVYFTAELNKLIARYDPASNTVDWILGVGQDRTHLLIRTKFLNEFFPDGRKRTSPSGAAAKASTSRPTTRKCGWQTPTIKPSPRFPSRSRK